MSHTEYLIRHGALVAFVLASCITAWVGAFSAHRAHRAKTTTTRTAKGES
jgi:hypothetical protein